jgi:hypothetical protein
VTLDDLYRFTLRALDRIVADQPSEFEYDEFPSPAEGYDRIGFARTESPCRRVAFEFDTPKGIVEVFQLTSVDGNEVEAERPARLIDPGAPRATADIVDVVCWVLVGIAESLHG